MTQSDDDIKFMKLAIEEARKAYSKDEIPVGAVITCKGQIVARAHNLTETLNDVTAHAEMQAITAAANTLGGKYLPECTLYVTLEPCIMCAGAIGWSQIRRIVFGASDNKRGYHTIAASSPFHPKSQIIGGVLADEASDLIKEFFKSKR